MISEYDFTYCPNCAAAFGKKEENLLLCSACGLHYYVNPKACNALLLENEKGEILFVKRKREPMQGYWDLPGGFVDIKETLEQSAFRELEEELQVKVNEIHYIGSMQDKYIYEGLETYTVCAIFLGKIDSNTKLTPSDDVSEYAFIAKDKIEYDRIAFDAMKEAIKKYVDASK